MKKTIRLTESDLQRIVRRVINEQTGQNLNGCEKGFGKNFMSYMTNEKNRESFKIENAPDGNSSWLKLTDPTGFACAVKKIDFFGSGL